MRVLAVVLALAVSSSVTARGDNFMGTNLGGTGGTTNNQGGFEQPLGIGRGMAPLTGGASSNEGRTLDSFGSALNFGTTAGGFQLGTAQASNRDQASHRAKDQHEQQLRKFDNGDYGAGRQDNQKRLGSLNENAFNKQDAQAQGSESHEARNYDQNFDKASENGQRQNDVNDKHGGALESVGRYDRQDIARNAGDKALAARKSAFARGTDGFENIHYGFNKNFDTNSNERGGFKEAVGQDNNHLDVYEENQSDNRRSKGILDAFLKSNDDNTFLKQSDWLSNAAQHKNINNQYGAADRLQNAAEQKNVDFNALFDRKNDKLWHSDIASDKALRQANDVAQKRADQQKKALAETRGQKGVQDNKYYGGGTFGRGTARAAGSGDTESPVVGLSTGTSPQFGSGGDLYEDTAGTGPVNSEGIVRTGNALGTVQTDPGKAKGRQENSGGDYLNQYKENARQADLANQKQASLAQSDAKALNNYNRGRGVDDVIEINGQRQGKWAKDKAGLRKANSQGFNGADANAAKAAELADNALEARASNSNLNAANKNLQAQELDRVNFKRNQVDSNQRVRKQKKFYHDKNEGGFNNEALAYNRNKGNKDFGEEQQAQKEARTRYNNAADDAKVNEQSRAYNILDARKISNANVVNKQRDNAGGWQNEKRQTNANALKNKVAFDNGRKNNEADTFGRNVQNRGQKLWDQARKDFTVKDSGSDKQRSVEAAFAFTPGNTKNNLGLGKQQASGGNAGRFNTGRTGFGSLRGPSVTQGSFMNEMGRSDFGKRDPFSGSGRTSFGGSNGGLYSDSNNNDVQDNSGSFF